MWGENSVGEHRANKGEMARLAEMGGMNAGPPRQYHSSIRQLSVDFPLGGLSTTNHVPNFQQ